MNKAHIISTLLLCATVFVGPITYANDSAQLQIEKLEAEVALSEEALSLESSCGAPITVTIDWADFPENAFEYSVAGYCESLLDALESHCTSGESKRQWIAENVSALSCAYVPDNTSLATVEVNGDVVTGRYSFDMSNLTDAFKKALLNSM